MTINLSIENSIESASTYAADIICQTILKKPNTVLGLATGRTPILVYQKLINYFQQGIISFKDVKTFNLDEYQGLPKDSKDSYHYYMWDNLFRHTDINLENTFIPDGMATNIDKMCLEYEQKIKECGGIDVQLLGIGANGHIGFNEPGSAFNSRTRLVKLADKTIEDNSALFISTNDVPKFAISMGIASILESKRIILLALGESKADIISDFLNSPRSEDLPASALHSHDNVDLILDAAAGKNLSNLKYSTANDSGR